DMPGTVISTTNLGGGSFGTELLVAAREWRLADRPCGRESPSFESLGHTQLTDIGGGLFRIDSFFDVFVEISFDGQTWLSSSNGPAHLDLVPAPGAGALVGLGGMVGLMGGVGV